MSSIRFAPVVLIALLGFCLAGTVLVPSPAAATGAPYPLVDVNQIPDAPDSGAPPAEPVDFFNLSGRLLFSTAGPNADEGILWSTDGTAGGTVQVSSSLCPSFCRRIRPLATWNGITLLSVTSGEAETSFLARTDGTSAGTFPLADPSSGEPLMGVGAVFAPAATGVLLFAACPASSGCQLWRSDGTPAGTTVFLAADGRPFESPHAFALQGGRIAFVAYQPDDSAEGVWITDGTPAGTVRLSDIQEDSDTGTLLLATPSHLFFTSGPTGEDLWATDGTPGHARRVADFPPIQCTIPPVTCDDPEVDSLFVDRDAAYFVTHRKRHGTEIWRSDGTVEGTGPVFELPAGLFLAATPQRLGERWLLSVNSSQRQRAFLWTADAGFTRAAPLTGCGDGGCPSFAGFLTSPSNGPRLFAGADGDHGIEPWITDGTGAGTRRLADVCPGPCSSLRLDSFLFPIAFPGPPGETYFRAYPSDGAASDSGDQLWITDGTRAGTHQVAGHVSDLGFLNGRTYFGAGHARRPASELWSTDGAPGDVRRVAVLRRLAPGSFPRFRPFQGGALFLASEAPEGIPGLWASDGTPAGTAEILGFPAGSGRSLGTFLSTAGPFQLFVVAHQEGVGASRSEIWRTDGTVPGTQPVIELGPRQGLDTNTATWAGQILFDVQGPAGCSFWTSDGTTAGTRQILPPQPGLPCPSLLVPFGSRFLIFTEAGDDGRVIPQLFVSDGTPAGTRQLTSIHGRRFLFLDNKPVQAGGKVFFRLASLYGDPGIWETDGTPEGTHRAFPLNTVDNLSVFGGSLYFTAALPSGDGFGLFRVPLPGGSPILLAPLTPAFSIPLNLTPVGDRLLFAAQDPNHGTELWTTDGTSEGTHILADLQPGAGSSNPQDFTVAGNRLFFSADDGTFGRELWETDGTPEGTRRVSDIAPGGFSALFGFPFQPVASNGFLFFAADDGETGLEPWALRLEP